MTAPEILCTLAVVGVFVLLGLWLLCTHRTNAALIAENARLARILTGYSSESAGIQIAAMQEQAQAPQRQHQPAQARTPAPQFAQ